MGEMEQAKEGRLTGGRSRATVWRAFPDMEELAMAKENGWKRVPGHAGLYRVSNGRFHIRFQVGGTTVSESVGTDETGKKKDLKAAKKRLAELRLKYGRGDTSPSDNSYSVARLKDEYLAYARGRCRERTADEYEQQLKRILGFMPAEQVTTITLALADAYAEHRLEAKHSEGGERSARTINKEVSCLRRMLKWGVKRGKIARDPLKDWEPLIERDTKLRRPFKPDEFARLLDHDHPNGNRFDSGPSTQPCQCYDMWLFLADTGLRVGEMQALRWADIEFDHRPRARILVRKHDDDDGPKTKASARAVPMTRSVEEMLRRRRESASSEHVFTTATGGPVKSGVWKKLQRCLKAAKISKYGLCVHSFRYFFASRLIQGCPEKGVLPVSPKTVQHLLGHRSVETTLRVYAHIMPGNDVDAIKGLDIEREPDNRAGATREQKRRPANPQQILNERRGGMAAAS